MPISRRGPLVAKARAEYPLREIHPCSVRPTAAARARDRGSGQMPYPQTAGEPTHLRIWIRGLREGFFVGL